MRVGGRTLILGLALAGLVAGAGYLAYERLRGPAAAAPDSTWLALGGALYGAHCAACHGAELEGEPNWRRRKPDGLLPAPPHDETGHTWHHPDGQLFEITKRGTAALVGSDYRTAMGPFGAVLSDDEIRAVLDYIKSRWPENIRARQAGITERAGN
jgi:mono/diheme cytochrome c family protein